MTRELQDAWAELKECSDWECETHYDHPEGGRIYPAFTRAMLNDPEGFLELLREEDLDDLETMILLISDLVEKDHSILKKIREALHGETSEIIEVKLRDMAIDYDLDPV